MNKYKVIIFDLDGTAIPNTPNGMPSKPLIDVIHKNRKSIRLCAATGRPITNAKAILSVLQLKDPCIISGGSQIIDPLTDEVLWEANLEPADVDNVLSICYPYHYEVLMRNELIGEGGRSSKRPQHKERVNVMYLMGCAPTDAKVILNQLGNLNNITAAGVTSWTREGVDIHITHKQATKEYAVAELIKILNVNKTEVIGVGDADNDVHLFKAVGYRVAMGNGTNRLKALADEIADSVENDGLAKIIDKYSENRTR